MSRFNAEKYFHNGAFDLSPELQNQILNKLNSVNHKEVSEAFSFIKEIKEKYNILVECDWIGHRGEWFFPTYEDALAQEDWLFSVAD